MRAVKTLTLLFLFPLFGYSQFSPRDINGLQLWLSADTGLTFSTGDTISQWADRSGSFHDATQGSISSQPRQITSIPLLNNKPVVRVDGVDDYMTVLAGLTVGTVFVISNWGDASAVFPTNNGLLTRAIGGPPWSFLEAAGGSFIEAEGPFVGGSPTIYKNGIQTNDYAPLNDYKINRISIPTPVAGFSNMVIGSDELFLNWYWKGDIAEVIIYDTQLNASQCQQVEDYLRLKYAPPVNLGPDIVMTDLCSDTLNATSGYAHYMWNGNAADSDSIFIYTGPGTYSVIVTDIFGFTSTDTIVVTSPINQPSDTVRICEGDTFIWHTNLTNPPYSFAWSTTDTTDSLVITAAGQYSVTVTDQVSLCSLTSGVVTVIVDTFPSVVSLGADTDSLCAFQNLGLIAGASQAVSYLWSTTATTSTIAVGSTDDDYWVEVQDANGCIGRDTIHVHIQGTAPSVSFTATTECFGDSTHFTNSSGGSSWSWNFNDPASGPDSVSNLQNPVHLFTSPGTYSVTLTASSSGCDNSITNAVVVRSVPTAGFNWTQPLCHLDSVFFTSINAPSDTIIIWQWNFGDPASGADSISTSTNPIHVYTTTGSFNAQLVVTSNNGCTDTVTNTVNVVSNVCVLPPLAGMQLWLSGDSGVVTSIGDSVTQWKDHTSAHNDAFQTTLNNEPSKVTGIPLLNYKPVIRLDGVDDYMIVPSGLNIGTVFVISNWGDNSSVFPTNAGLLTRQAGPPWGLLEAATGSFIETEGFPAGTTTIYKNGVLSSDYAPLHYYKMNRIALSSTLNNFTGMIIGWDELFSNWLWKGDVAEIIIYDSILTSTQCQQVETYLHDKYAPPVDLGPDIAWDFCPDTLHASPRFISYLWGDGSSDSTLRFTQPGTYSVVVTDVFGFTSTDQVVVSTPFNQLRDTTICAGSSLIWHSNLSGNYSYLWSTGDTTDSLVITAAGQYSVTVTNNTSTCSFTSQPITVSIDNFPNTASLGPDLTLCSGQSIGLTIGAPQTLSYVWSPSGATTTSIAIVTTGDYSVIVHDSLNCSAYDTIHVDIQGTAPVVNFSAPDVCSGILTPFTNLSPVSDSSIWYFGDTLSYPNDTSTLPNPTHIFSGPGTYLVTLTVSDSGCNNSITKPVTVYSNPSVAFTYNQPLCLGDTIQFTDASTSSDPITAYHWNFGDAGNAPADTSDQQNPRYNFSSTGNYTVQLTVTTNHGCQNSTTGPVNVISNNCTLPPLTGMQIWLSADSGVVTSSGSSVTRWKDQTPLANDAIQAVLNNEPSKISVINLLNYKPVLRFDGTDDFMTVPDSLTVGTVFIISNWGDDTATAFPGYNGLLTRTGPSPYALLEASHSDLTKIRTEPPDSAKAIYTNSSASDYYTPLSRYKLNRIILKSPVTNFASMLIGNDEGVLTNSWKGDVAEIIIYNDTLDSAACQQVENYLYNKYAPPVSLGPDITFDTFCDTILHASPRFINYVWNGDTALHDSTLIVSRPGTYSVVVTDVFGFTSTDQVIVTSPLNQLAAVDTICLGSTLTWNTNLSGPTYSFLWNTGDTTSSLVIDTAGQYEVTVTNNVYGCTFTSDTITVRVDSFPVQVSVGNDTTTLCAGQSIGLTAGASQAATYLWSTGATTSTTIVTATDTGNLYVTVHDNFGCIATDSTFIIIQGVAPTVNFSADSVCQGDSTHFADLSSSGTTWSWNFGDPASGTDSVSSLQNPSHLFTAAGTYLVSLTVYDAGCFNTVTKSVIVYPLPTAGFTYLQPLCHGDTVMFTYTPVATDTVIAWEWNFGDAISAPYDTSTQQNPIHNFSFVGNFTVRLIVTSIHGCKDTATASVNVISNNCSLPPATGLQLWLSADTGITFNAATDSVMQWADRSGRGNDATQPVSINQPRFIPNICLLNNKPALHFDGLDDFMNVIDTLKVGTVFVLGNWTGGGSLFADYYGLLSRAGTPATLIEALAGSAGFRSEAGDNLALQPQWYMNNILFNNYFPFDTYKILRLVLTGSIPGYNNMIIGNDEGFINRSWNGDIAEIIVYDTTLTANQSQQVEAYLRYKYAKPVSLGPDITLTNICPYQLDASCRYVSYEWDNNPAYDSSTFTVTRSGQYTVKVTDIFGQTSIDTINVTFPFYELPQTNNLCAGSTLPWNTLLSDSLQFQWLGDTGTTPSINITSEGLYAFTVTDTNRHCTFVSDTVFVDVDSLPIFAAIGPSDHDTTLCVGNTLSLIAGQGAATYLWSPSGATDTSITVLTSGMYSLVVTDNNGCTGEDSVLVTIGGIAPTAIFSSAPTCEGDPMQFTHSSIANSGNITSVLWNFGDPGSGANNTSTNAAPSHLYSDTLPHLVTLTVFTDSSCQNYVTHLVKVVPKPDVNFTLTNACEGTVVNFFDSSQYFTNSRLSLFWNFDLATGNVDTSTAMQPSHIYTTSGNYVAMLIAYNTLGCHDTAVKVIQVHKTVIPSFSNSTTCFGNIMQLFGTSNAGIQDTVNWLWNFGDGGISYILTPSHFYAASGNYLVSLTATTSNNCIATSTHFVTVNPKPSANFLTSPSPCLGSPYTFVDASTISLGNIVQWDWNVIGKVQFDSVYAPVYTFDSLNTYNVQLTVTSAAGCTATITKPITVRPLPVASFTMNPSYGTPPLTVTFPNSSQNASTYSWTFGDGGSSSLTTPQHTYVDTGNYCVWLTATSQYGCVDSITDCIYVIRPRRDVAVQDISASAANNSLSISARIANLGTLDIESVFLKASLPDGTSITELYNHPLPAAATANYSFIATLTIPPSSNHDYYCVEAILPNGLVDDVPSNNKKCKAIVSDYSVVEPYPNPFSDVVNLDVVLPYDDYLTIELFNSIGQRLQTLYEGMAYAGLNNISADLATLAEGTYAVRFTFRDNIKVKEVVKASRKK